MNSEGNTNEISEEFEFRLTSLLNAWDGSSEMLELSFVPDDDAKKIYVNVGNLELAKVRLESLKDEVDFMLKYCEGISSN